MRTTGKIRLYHAAIRILVCLPIVQPLLCSWMPGLNSDMAHMGISAYRLVHGEKSGLEAETPYGGVIRIHLIAFSFLLFGAGRISLELPFALFNAMTVLFVYLLMRKLFSEEAGVVCALVLSVCPWFVIREIDNWYYFIAALALYLFSLGARWSLLLGGVAIGLGCYEHQLATIIPLSLMVAYLVYRRNSGAGVGEAALVLCGVAAGFLPRLAYSLFHATRVYMEPLNGPVWIIKNAIGFIPYFWGMLNGPVIYLRNTGCVRIPVIPVNGILFLGAVALLLSQGERKVCRPLVVFFGMLYLSVFLVIKYTAIRYFILALFAAALITGLGIYLLSLRHRSVAGAMLAVFISLNMFYLGADFFSEFGRTGGAPRLFSLGNLVEASHHLVRTDVLYDCLDKTVPVLVIPEPFIEYPIRFYDLKNKHFTTIVASIGKGYDDFYFIDYSRSKLGIAIDPSRFPGYRVVRECTGCRNFSVWRFTRHIRTQS